MFLLKFKANQSNQFNQASYIKDSLAKYQLIEVGPDSPTLEAWLAKNPALDKTLKAMYDKLSEGNLSSIDDKVELKAIVRSDTDPSYGIEIPVTLELQLSLNESNPELINLMYRVDSDHPIMKDLECDAGENWDNQVKKYIEDELFINYIKEDLHKLLTHDLFINNALTY